MNDESFHHLVLFFLCFSYSNLDSGRAIPDSDPVSFSPMHCICSGNDSDNLICKGSIEGMLMFGANPLSSMILSDLVDFGGLAILAEVANIFLFPSLM